jgi:DNA repair exonuclease SbcCD ATPase subunit
MHPYVVRKLDPSPADAAEDGNSLSSSVSSSSLNLRSASTPTTGRYGPTLTHLDKSTDGQRDERESNFFETKALKARISELEDALRDSEAESRKLRHTVTQIQEAFARESAELSTVSMSLYASKESENALRSQLKNLEAEREILKLKKTQTQKQDNVIQGHDDKRDELNEIKENTARKDLHSNASTDARIQELEQELKNKDHKIARLETILIETASSATAKTEPAKVSEVIEKPALRDDLNQETGQRPATSRERDKHSDRQRQREGVRDPEMEQYEQVPGPSAPTHVDVDKEKERKKERDRERDRERSRAARMINALEVALIDIRECMIKSMGPRKHPPKSSRNRPLDESAVSAYREEIIVEIMQRKSAASALEQDLNTANSRREAAEAQAAAVVAAVADAEEIAGDEAQRPEAEANAKDIGGEEGLAASEQEKRSAKQTKIWEARVRSLENTLVQKNEELRVTKESQDKKQKLRIDELEAEVSLMKGRVKSLMQQIEQSKKTSGSAHAVHAQDEAILDDRDEVQKDQLEQCELLGSGAFAEVYRGWWRRPVAIKKFRSVARQEQIDSFARETKVVMYACVYVFYVHV